MQGPRLYRFFNYEKPGYIAAPVGGWNPDVDPWQMPPTQAQQLDNFLIRPGKIALRGALLGGTTGFTSFTPINPRSMIFGEYSANNGVYAWYAMTRATVSSTHFVDPWDGPSGWLGANFTTGNLNLVIGVAGATAPTTVTVTADQLPGPRWINFDGLIYAISYDTAGALAGDTNGTYAMKPLSLITMPVSQSTITGAGFTKPTVLTNAPHGGFDIKGYQSRIWMLGGIDTPGGLTAHESQTLYFTVPGTSSPVIGTLAADWKDPVSGLTNKIRMDNNSRDYGVGLALVRGGMVIFRRNSVWLLKGTTTANYTLIPISKEVGCLDARSIVETDQGVYWMSHKGLMMTNGTTVVNVSGSVTNTLQQAIHVWRAQKFTSGSPTTTAGLGGWITCTLSSTGQIHVSIGNYPVVSGAPTGNQFPIFCGTFDPGIKGGPWTRVTSTAFGNDNNTSSANNLLPPVYTDNNNMYRYYTVTDLNMYALEDLALSVNIMDPLSGNQLSDYSASGSGYTAIPAVWYTHFFPSSTQPERFAQLKRFYVDYNLAGQMLASTVLNGFTVKAISQTGGQIGQTLTAVVGSMAAGNRFVLNSGGAGVGALNAQAYQPSQYIMRQNIDAWSEYGDIFFEVVWNNNSAVAASQSSIFEIYGIGGEFQQTSDRR